MPEKAQLLVYGDVQLDKWYTGDLDGFTRESAAAPNLTRVEWHYNLGGAGNVAANAAAQCAKVQLFGHIGPMRVDADLLEEMARKARIELSAIPSLPYTSTNIRLAARPSHVLSRASLYAPPSRDGVAEAMAAIRYEIDTFPSNILVLSDGGRGAFSFPGEIAYLVKYARSKGVPVLVDPRPGDWGMYEGATLIKPSLAEVGAFQVTRQRQMKTAEEESREICRSIHGQYLPRWVLLTRGGEGMFLSHQFCTETPKDLFLPGVPQQVCDVTGAGDTVLATIAAGLAEYKADALDCWEVMQPVVELAHAAAGLAVATPGVAVISDIDVHREWLRRWRANLAVPRGFQTVGDMRELLLKVWAARRPICWINGCFDILHRGHLRLFEEARKIPDAFILVLVNDDESVRALKGPDRPRVPLSQRLEILSALQCVDAAAGFAGNNPNHLLEYVRPTYLLKGAEYANHISPEWDALVATAERNCLGKPVYVDMVPGVSSTSLIIPIPEAARAQDPGSPGNG